MTLPASSVSGPLVRGLAMIAGLAAMAGCTSDARDAMREPQLSPVGAGLYSYPPVAVQPGSFPSSGPHTKNSLWTDDRADFYQDPRALSEGDIVTVKINIKDQASLDNKSNRSRQAGIGPGLKLGGSFGSFGVPDVGVDLSATGNSTSSGAGKVERSEDIDLSVAAVVGQKLPNGNLFISGQQEVRVNYEVRVLSIAGIIRPRDILPDNTINYDKIAEARISYGGRGRVSDVQQPGWGQQVFDTVMPY